MKEKFYFVAALLIFSYSSYSQLYGGIEIGSKGVKMTVLEVENLKKNNYDVKEFWTENVGIATGISIDGTLFKEDIERAVAVVLLNYNKMLTEYKIEDKNIFIVASSGVGLATNTAEMMADCGNFMPDEAAVNNATVDDLDENTIKTFLNNKFETVLQKKGMTGDKFKQASLDDVCGTIAQGHDKVKLLGNLHFILPNGKLTVAAILLFAKYTQRWLPVMTAKCISFVGNFIGGTQFRDKVNDTDMEGNLLHQFETIMSFFTRNLKTVQVKKEFNSQGQLEIPYTCLVELVVNALVHRSLNWKAPIRIFIFDDRVEIHSPGTLPNGLSVDDIVAGTSMPRNNFLFANAIYLLPYTGAGSGIQRAMSEDNRLSFSNNEALHEFVITIARDVNTNSDTNSDTLSSDLDTKRQNLDTDSDTFDVNSDTREQDVEADSDTFDADSDTKNRIKLNKKQKDIINFCNIPRSSKEILERVGVSYHSKNIEKYINILVKAGYLEMTNPENPNASNQKYRRKIKK